MFGQSLSREGKWLTLVMIDDSIGTAVEDIIFKPEACASILTIPNPSNVEGRSRITIACISSGTRAVAPKKITDLSSPFCTASFLVCSINGPSPTNRRVDCGSCECTI